MAKKHSLTKVSLLGVIGTAATVAGAVFTVENHYRTRRERKNWLSSRRKP